MNAIGSPNLLKIFLLPKFYTTVLLYGLIPCVLLIYVEFRGKVGQIVSTGDKYLAAVEENKVRTCFMQWNVL